MLKTYEYTHSNNRRAETLEQSAKMFFKANPQLKGEWEAKIYAMAANGGGNGDSAIFMKAFEFVSAAWFIDNRDRL